MENTSSGKHSIQTSKEYTLMQEDSYLFQFVWLGKWDETTWYSVRFPWIDLSNVTLLFSKLNSKIAFALTRIENWIPGINQERVWNAFITVNERIYNFWVYMYMYIYTRFYLGFFVWEEVDPQKIFRATQRQEKFF